MVAGVILAAGQARRMGQAKQLLLLDEKPMIWHVAATACKANLDEVIVITGAYEAEVQQAVADLPVKVIYNEDWANGQSTSVKKAVQGITAEIEAVVFMLADQPLVDSTLINDIISAYGEKKSSIVVPRSQNRRGNPVLFDLGVWRSALLQLSGDQGARQIIKENQEIIHYVELLDGDIFTDIDTLEDYKNMKKIWHTQRRLQNKIIDES